MIFVFVQSKYPIKQIDKVRKSSLKINKKPDNINIESHI